MANAFKFTIEMPPGQIQRIGQLAFEVQRKYTMKALKAGAAKFMREVKKRIPDGYQTGSSFLNSAKQKQYKSFRESVWLKPWDDSTAVNVGAPLFSVSEQESFRNRLWGKAWRPVYSRFKNPATKAWSAVNPTIDAAIIKAVDKAVQKEWGKL